MRWDTTPVSVEAVKKLVMQAKMQTVDSARTDFRDSAKVDILVQGTTWQPDIRGRSRQLVGFMWRRTFESPINVKQRDTDIVEEWADNVALDSFLYVPHAAIFNMIM